MKIPARERKVKRIITVVLSVVLAVLLMVNPICTVIIYECIFHNRFETAPWIRYDVSEFDGLKMERSDFYADNGVTLAGYKYSKETESPKGVVVISHGMGGGGQNAFMPFADVFTSNGYYVFAYDARGNDNSGGNTLRGLPQGIIDLDYAIHHLTAIPEYSGLPVFLFGHSWGAYSAGNVLYMHPDIKAAVLVAGFNDSADLIYHRGKNYSGPFTKLLMPYVDLYERIKFGGEFSSVTAIKGLEKTDARIMIVHSADDETVPTEYGYDKFYDRFADNDRFEFVLYENRGHDYVFYSKDAFMYKEKLNYDYKNYVESMGLEYSEETKIEFMNQYLDKKKAFEPDPELMEKIISMYDKAVAD